MHMCEMACKRTAIEQPASSSKKVRRQVAVVTFKKWQSQFELEHQSLSWLRCDICKDNRGLIDKLWYELCKYEHSIQSLNNVSRAWITGSSNHKTSNMLDHASSDQLCAAMMKERVARAKATNQPIASSLLTMDKAVKKRMKKFDICYLLANNDEYLIMSGRIRPTTVLI